MSKKIKISGFRMHQAILKEFLFIRDESFERPTASAYTVYLTMLKQQDIEKNQRGYLKEYNLSAWAKKLNIPYSSLYGGKLYLEKHNFVKEEINEIGQPVLALKDVEKYNNPGIENGKLNYLIIPDTLFETNILAELVRTSNPEGIELVFSLLNQFRTAMSKKETIEITELYQERKMDTLKKQLNKNAKKVREVLSILEPLFLIDFVGLHYRKNQIWIKKVKFTLKEECVIEQSLEEFNVGQFTAILSHELTYFLDGLKVKYKPRDQFDIILSFKQEVFDKLKYIKSNHSFNKDKAIKLYFLECLDNLAIYIKKQRELKKTFRIYSLGALCRKAFRKNIITLIKRIPYELVHDAKLEQYSLTGSVPDFPEMNM